MDDDIKDLLLDIIEQANDVKGFTEEMVFDSYVKDRKTQAAVERKFEIIGEALNRISKIDKGLVESIRNYRRVISFRNILAHAYDHIEDRIIWGIIESDLDFLIQDVKALQAFE